MSIPPFRYSAIPLFRHSAIPPFRFISRPVLSWYSNRDHKGFVTSKPLAYFWPLAEFGMTPLYKILPHTKTTDIQELKLVVGQIEGYVSIIIKFGTLTLNFGENLA